MSDCVFILVSGIERFLVLEAMAERLKVDADTRDRLKEAEAYIRVMNTRVDRLPTRADIGPGPIFPNNCQNTLAGSD